MPDYPSLKSDPAAAIPVWIAGAPLGTNPAAIGGGYAYRNIVLATTTLVKTGPGILGAIIVNNPGAAVTATVYDSLTATGTKIGTLTLAAGQNLIYDVNFGIGLTIVTSGVCDITMAYA